MAGGGVGSNRLESPLTEDLDFDAGMIIKNGLVKKFVYHAIVDALDPFTYNDIGGTGADNGVQDGKDEGRQIQTGNTTSNDCSLDLNDIRHFDPANCVIYGMCKRDDPDSGAWCGLVETGDPSDTANEAIVYRDDTVAGGGTYKTLAVLDGTGSFTSVATDVPINTNLTRFKIVCSPSDQKLYLLVAGQWTLKATQNTYLPTSSLQPIFYGITRTNSAKTVTLSDMVVIDDS